MVDRGQEENSAKLVLLDARGHARDGRILRGERGAVHEKIGAAHGEFDRAVQGERRLQSRESLLQRELRDVVAHAVHAGLLEEQADRMEQRGGGRVGYRIVAV